MNKTVRMLALTGAALATGLSLGVAPASAAPAAPVSASVQADHKGDQPNHRGDQPNDRGNRDDHKGNQDDRWAQPSKQRFIGYYRSAGKCVSVGKVGKFHKKWDGFECDKVHRGLHRNQYSLTVNWDRHSARR